jgi:drug/metabolite transporter (DMT)-like permease
MLFGEPLTMRMMIATVVVIVGVFLIVSAGGPEPERRTHHPMTSGHRHVRQRQSEPVAISSTGRQASG